MSIDLGHVARDLGLPADIVQRTVELLDEGNTVPFITRFRKDQTGGLDEEQVRRIQEAIVKVRQLADRKQTILKSVEAQGKLTPEWVEQVRSARSIKHLEDLYLPFKPKKQTLATLARQRGLEPFAEEILEGKPLDLSARAAEFVSAERGLASTDDVLAGVGHLIVENLADRAELRSRLRRSMQRTGRIVSTRIESEKKTENSVPANQSPEIAGTASQPGAFEPGPSTDAAMNSPNDSTRNDTSSSDAVNIIDPELEPHASSDELGLVEDHPTAEEFTDLEHGGDAIDVDDHEEIHAEETDLASDLAYDEADDADAEPPVEAEPTSIAQEAPNDLADFSSLEGAASEPHSETDPENSEPAAGGEAAHDAATLTAANSPGSATAPVAKSFPRTALAARISAKQQARAAAREAKKKKRQKLLESAFKDYYNFQEPLGKIPHHRILALNRGERARVLRVKIDVDLDALHREAEELLIRADHPHADFLRGCLKESLSRSVIPSLERELRRELTERAETHAVEVFIRNLRKLLLQPPVRNRRVLAVDPGFRSGCKLTALNEFGSVLDHGMIHVIGSEQHRLLCRSRLIEIIERNAIAVVAIGNGTACRETELLIADVLAKELSDRDLAYVIVNEAGASFYSTSPIGREELPKYDVTVRSAVSIGRRLLDPLSELVKINPANIGVGLYQHDVKAKHLRESLDDVVASCVNFVGVDVNTASPALLRYVSGLNQLTARRLYEYRQQHGPFKNREQFKQVPGFGDATFVQAAGFLKISGGDNPLDSTWIHPESYDIARRVLEKLGASVEALVPPPPAGAATGTATPPTAEEAATVPATESPAVVNEPSGETGTGETGTGEPLGALVVEAPPTALSPQASELSNAPVLESTAEGGSTTAISESLAARIASVNSAEFARELGIGQMLLDDMLAALARPARDPREDLPPPVFRRGIMKLEDLAPGMELSGTVLNVVDFGAFVDIGLSDSALIHISRLADRFIRDPHEVVGVGDILTVWVVDVDKQRRRVSLTAIRPGSQRPQQPRQQQRPQQSRPVHPAHDHRPAGRQGAGQETARPAGGRPPASRSNQGGTSQRTDGPPGRRSTRPPKFKQPPPKPVPLKPITKKMIDGKEPMRTFGDLLQFYQHKNDDDAPDASGKQGS